MEEVQERRCLCKICGMSFSNGRVLGGHMKGHVNRIARETLKARGGDAADELGHVPRDIVSSTPPDPRFDFECKICSKGFASIKGLFGHMRLHPRKDKEEAKKKKTKAVIMESDHHATSDVGNDLYHCPVRGKRSIRVHYDVESSDSEMEEENVKEVAFCLILLSRGVRNSEGYDSSDKMVENQSTAADNLSCKRGIKVEIADSDDGNKAESAESSSSSKNGGGGVVGVHRKQKKRAKKIHQSCSTGAALSSYTHKCSICSKEFMSARALGGHKRSHTMKNAAASVLQAAAAAAKTKSVAVM